MRNFPNTVKSKIKVTLANPEITEKKKIIKLVQKPNLRIRVDSPAGGSPVNRDGIKMVKGDGFTEVQISFKIPESEAEQGPRKVA